MKCQCLKLLLALVLTGIFAVAGGCKKEYVHVGENWKNVHNLQKPKKTFAVSVTGNDSAKVGKELSYQILSEQSGKLWVVQVDPADEMTVLFPNDKATDNAIKANVPLSIPPSGAGWSIEASEPKGESVVVFVVTTGDTDIEDVLTKEKSMDKAIRLIETTPAWGFDKKVVEIK